METELQDEYISITEAANKYGVHRNTILEWLNSSKIVGTRKSEGKGYIWLVSVSSLIDKVKVIKRGRPSKTRAFIEKNVSNDLSVIESLPIIKNRNVQNTNVDELFVRLTAICDRLERIEEIRLKRLVRDMSMPSKWRTFTQRCLSVFL